jgi:amidase
MLTTAGSFALVNSIPKGDAPVVAKLRAKGGIILGKANLTEFANYKGDIPSGWSQKGGQTKSAYGPGAFPGDVGVGGSSSGSAVGVSAGFAAGAIGTETHGSIIGPSSRAALYGIKATVGLIPRKGIVPFSTTTDSVGPMAKSAYDTALLLGAMMTCDSADPAGMSLLLSITVYRTDRLDPTRTAKTVREYICGDYVQFTKGTSASFSGKRLGVPRALFYDHQFWK